jgi:hypothetical protein
MQTRRALDPSRSGYDLAYRRTVSLRSLRGDRRAELVNAGTP